MQRRNTPQKQEILDAVCQMKNHPTAEQVYAFLQQQHSTTSKATVYRVLRQLAEQGKLRLVQMPQGADRYDTALADHHHVRCIRCGKITDVQLDPKVSFRHALLSDEGYVVTDCHLLCEGLCPDCQHLSPSWKTEGADIISKKEN